MINSIRGWIVLFLLCVCFAETTSATDVASSGFRLITYNVWYGFSKLPDRKTAYLRWMKDQAPDIVALQELNGYTDVELAKDAEAWGHSHLALLKTHGFPTGITSREPIEDIQRTIEGFHHGLLRVKIRGIYFYVVHLHPSNWEARIRESKLILQDVARLPEGSEVILAGDFNTFSSADARYYRHGELRPFFQKRDEKLGERNLRNGKLDYSVVDRILNAGFTDLEDSRRDAQFVFSGSFPTKIEKTGDHGSARRLDYVFATNGLAKRTREARAVASERTWKLSDHLPVVVDFAGEGSK